MDAVAKSNQPQPLHFITLHDFGAVGDGITDDTAAVQAAIDASAVGQFQALFVTKGIYKLTAPIVIRRGITIIGDGCEPYHHLATQERGRGSWFHLAHAGKGFIIEPLPGTDVSGYVMQGVGTFRDQPIPGAALYVPGNFDWDIYVANSDVALENITLLNPTKGIFVTNLQTTGLDPFSRVNINNIRGQPLRYGIVIENSLDVCRISNVHWWCFWVENEYVWDFTANNCIGIQLARCDSPFLLNIFMIFCHIGFNIVSSSAGKTSKLSLTNAQVDISGTGILVAEQVNGFTCSIVNFWYQGDTNKPEQMGLSIDGSYSKIDITNMDVRNTSRHAVVIAGTSNDVAICNSAFLEFNRDNDNSSAIQVAASNRIVLSGGRRFSGMHGGSWFEGNGSIECELGSGTTEGTTDGAGFVVTSYDFGTTPRRVFVQSTATYGPSSTIVDLLYEGWFRTRHFDVSGAPMANKVVRFHWMARY